MVMTALFVMAVAAHAHLRMNSHYNSQFGRATEENRLRIQHEVPQDLSEKTTVVVQGYSPKRMSNYETLLLNYASSDAIDRVLLVWNNRESPPPTVPQNLTGFVKIILPAENLMYNRFNITENLRTESVLIVDDDRMLTPQLIKCMVRTWRKHPDKQIGLDMRRIGPDTYNSVNKPEKGYNIVLVGSSIISSRFLSMFIADEALTKHVREVTNCDDIFMAALISTYGSGPLFASPNGEAKLIQLPEEGGLHLDRPLQHWISARKNCSNFALSHFGKAPLRVTSEYEKC